MLELLPSRAIREGFSFHQRKHESVVTLPIKTYHHSGKVMCSSPWNSQTQIPKNKVPIYINAKQTPSSFLSSKHRSFFSAAETSKTVNAKVGQMWRSLYSSPTLLKDLLWSLQKHPKHLSSQRGRLYFGFQIRVVAEAGDFWIHRLAGRISGISNSFSRST